MSGGERECAVRNARPEKGEAARRQLHEALAEEVPLRALQQEVELDVGLGVRGRHTFAVFEHHTEVGVRERDIGIGYVPPVALRVRPLWGEPYDVPVPDASAGGHGGDDALLLADLPGAGGTPDPLGRAAGVRDGAYSVLTGVAANESFATGLPVNINVGVSRPEPPLALCVDQIAIIYVTLRRCPVRVGVSLGGVRHE